MPLSAALPTFARSSETFFHASHDARNRHYGTCVSGNRLVLAAVSGPEATSACRFSAIAQKQPVTPTRSSPLWPAVQRCSPAAPARSDPPARPADRRRRKPCAARCDPRQRAPRRPRQRFDRRRQLGFPRGSATRCRRPPAAAWVRGHRCQPPASVARRQQQPQIPPYRARISIAVVAPIRFVLKHPLLARQAVAAASLNHADNATDPPAVSNDGTDHRLYPSV